MTPEEKERIQQIDILYQDGQVKLRPHQIQDDIHFLLSLIDRQEEERKAWIKVTEDDADTIENLEKDFEVMRGLAIDMMVGWPKGKEAIKSLDEEYRRRRGL
jgi:hypothetical protein